MEKLTIKGWQLADLAAVSVAAADKKTRQTMPNLGTVHLSLNGHRLQAVATDRYILAAGECTIYAHAENLNCAVEVDSLELSAAAKLYAKTPDVELLFGEDALIISSNTGQTVLKYADISFPNYVGVLDRQAAPVENMEINADIFAKLAKIRGGRWAAEFTGENGPVYFSSPAVQAEDVAYRVAVMPMRKPS